MRDRQTNRFIVTSAYPSLSKRTPADAVCPRDDAVVKMGLNRIPPADFITAIRIVLSGVLLFPDVFSPAFYAVFVSAAATDALDGPVARRTHTESRTGAVMDSVADVFFVAVCLITIVSAVSFPLWSLVWAAVIAAVRAVNIVTGYVMHGKVMMLHTAANRLTGCMLFLLVFLLDTDAAAVSIGMVCAVATFAAVQEGHLIRTGAQSG